MLAVDHVANRDLWKIHVTLRWAVGGGTRYSIAQGIDRNDVILGAVNQLPRSDRVNQILRRTSKPGCEYNYVRLLGVQLSEGAITNATVANDFAADKLEIPQGCEAKFLCSGCPNQ